MNETTDPLSNVRVLCSECAPKPDARYRRLPLETFFGKLCKLTFATEVADEHMWVRCTGLAEHGKNKLGGTLDNHPVLADGLQFGDWIEFRRSEIEDLFPAEEESTCQI